jgi:DNA-directed RNA polymerase subunit F
MRGPAESLARALAKQLLALEEGPVRAGAAARALAVEAPEVLAGALSALARRADAEARVVLAAVGQALLDPCLALPYDALAELYSAAAAQGLTEVTALLVAPPPRRLYQEPRDKADARLAQLTLGHKKALARARRDPDLLARLAAEGTPTVVRELLQNPQLTEELVVRIAARRPCRPETLRCVAESRRWRTRPAVARALARNPYAEPAVATKLLPFLGSADLGELAVDNALHGLVRALAARLVRQREDEAWGGK